MKLIALASILLFVSTTFANTKWMCLSPKEVSVSFCGGPSSETLPILQELKKDDVKATFFVDSDKLSQGNMAAMVKNMIDDGHVVGMYLGKNHDLNSMSPEGFRGFMSYRDTQFKTATGVSPLYIQVAKNTNDQVLESLEYMGYLVESFGKYIELPDAKSTKSAISADGLLRGGITVGVKEQDSDAYQDYIHAVIKQAKEQNLEIVNLNQCIGRSEAYRKENKVQFASPNESFLNRWDDDDDDDQGSGSSSGNDRKKRMRKMKSNSVRSVVDPKVLVASIALSVLLTAL